MVETIIADVIIGILSLAVNGAKARNGMKKEVQAKLVKVYLEVCKNKTILIQSGLLKTSRITYDDDTFISIAKKLSNKEITPLFKFNEKRIFFPNAKKEVERRKTQYALNYIVKQIDALEAIATVKRNRNSPDIRILPRLKTLEKHLTTLEKVLSPVGKKK